MNELTQQCLSLAIDERIRLTHILQESLKNERDDQCRFNILLKIATDVVGKGIMTKSRNFNCIIGRRMIAYQMRNEGCTLMMIGFYLNKNHSSVLHMIRMMKDIFKFPGVFKIEEAYWHEFTTKLKEYDIHRRTTQGSQTI